MSYTSKALRVVWTTNRIERAVRNPGHYTKNRVKSKAFGAVGGWSLLRKFWRA